MRNRFYSPSTGRFITEDPIGFAGGDISFYRYVLNDPVNLVDPLGLISMNTIMFAVDFAEGLLMPTTPPPTYGGLMGYLARDQFDTYVDLNKVTDFIVDEWIEYLDRDPFTRPKKLLESQYKPSEYYWEAPETELCK